MSGKMERAAFLLSGWYSGATLLTMLLDRHPEIVSNGEGFPFSTRYQGFVCTCGERLFNCEFYRFAAAHMLEDARFDPRLFVRNPVFELPGLLRRFARSPRFIGKPREALLNLLPSCRQHADDFRAAHLRFMERALEYYDGRVYLDGTKDLRRAELLATRIEVPMHFWLLVKDCRGFCASMLRSRKWTKARATDVAKEWVEYIRHARRLAKAFPMAEFRTIRYEDLCREPDRILDELCGELGLQRVGWEDVPSQQPHLLGNIIRKQFDGKVEVRRPWWKDALDQETQDRIVRIAGPTMRELGYL